MIHRVRFAWLRASPLLGILSLVFAACGSSSDGGGSGAGCNSIQVSGQKYVLLLACDVPNLFGSGAHSCTEFFSNVPQVAASFQAFCGAEGGSKTDHCPTSGNLGSCTGSSSTATGTQGAIEVSYGYPDARGNGSAAQFAADCDSGIYAPPGAPPASGAPTGSNVASTCPATSPTSSGVAFSVATLVNGEYLECTNYVGAVSADQLASVLKIGATTSPCPEQNALCACTKKKAGTFSTDATLVYYKTSMASSASACDGVATGCDTYTDSYKAP